MVGANGEKSISAKTPGSAEDSTRMVGGWEGGKARDAFKPDEEEKRGQKCLHHKKRVTPTSASTGV